MLREFAPILGQPELALTLIHKLLKNSWQTRNAVGTLHEDELASQSAEMLIVIQQSAGREVSAGQRDPKVKSDGGQKSIEPEAQSGIE